MNADLRTLPPVPERRSCQLLQVPRIRVEAIDRSWGIF